MNRSSRILHGLFCVCCTIAIVLIISWSGYAVAAAAFLGIWAALRRKTVPHFTRWLFVGGLALRLLIIALLRPPLESDFQLLYNTAQSVLQGGTILSVNGAYFSAWAYQSGIVLWEAFWLRLWNDPLCLKLVNAVLCSGTVCLVYRMLRRWVSRTAAQAAALLLTMYPSFLVYHVVLFNGIPSAFFLTLGLWVLVCEDCLRLGFWRYPLAGLCVECGILLRSDGIIALTAALVWVIFSCFRHPKTAKQLLLGGTAFLAVLFLVHTGADAAVKASGLNPYGIANMIPEWKLVAGLNQETAGNYAEQDAMLLVSHLGEGGLPTPETREALREIIRQRLSVGPMQLLFLAYRKLQFLWQYDHLYFAWSRGETSGILDWLVYNEQLLAHIRSFDWGLMALGFGLMGFGLWGPGWKERYPTAAYLPFFVFFAALCALLPLEIQPHYTYLPRIYLFAAAAFGLDRIPPSGRFPKEGPDRVS